MGKGYVIGIDPDIDKNGVALIDKESRKAEIEYLSFPETLEWVRGKYEAFKRAAEQDARSTFMVHVEAGWLNKGNWHVDESQRGRFSPSAYAAAVGTKTGACNAVSMKLLECFEFYGVPARAVRPLRKCWKGRDRKITHEELIKEMMLYRVRFPYKRTNQETRDAALIALVNI